MDVPVKQKPKRVQRDDLSERSRWRLRHVGLREPVRETHPADAEAGAFPDYKRHAASFSEGGRAEFPLLLVAGRSTSQSRCIARPIRAAVLCKRRRCASARRGARSCMRADRTTAMFPPYKTAAVADLVPYARNART